MPILVASMHADPFNTINNNGEEQMFEHTTSRKQASRLAPVDSSLFANGCVCCEIVLGFAGDLVIRKLSTVAIIVKSSSQVESYGYRSISKSHPIVQHEKACSDHVVAKMSQPSTLRLQQLVGRCCFCDGAARKNKSTLQSESWNLVLEVAIQLKPIQLH